MSKKSRRKGHDEGRREHKPVGPALRDLYARAEALLAAGRPDEALSVCRLALASDPVDAFAHALAGTALAQKGDTGAARQAFLSALSRNPGLALASLNLARLESAAGHGELAADILKASAERTEDPGTLMALADCAMGAGLLDTAEPIVAKAVGLRPQDAQLRFRHAVTLQTLHRNDEAVKGFRAVLSLQPNVGAANANIGAIFAESGKYEEARNQYALAARSGGPARNGFLFRRALLSPTVFSSPDQIDDVRARMSEELDALAQGDVRLTDPPHEVGTANFYLTYHGRPDKHLQSQVARTYLTACPSLGWTSPHSMGGAKGRRARIGFCSAFFRDHTVGKVYEGVIRGLDRDAFEVVVLSTAPPRDDVAVRIARSADTFVVLPSELKAARQTVADEKLDVLVYADIGMDAFTYFLSFARLAPVQCVGWGHPDTTGVPNVDYYLSAETFEPDGAQDHYSEHLALLPRIYCDLQRPPEAKARASKADAGLPESGRLYLCAQSLFKFHPDFDSAVAAVLRRDPQGKVVFFETSEQNWVRILKERLQSRIPDVADQVLFLPRLSPDRFLDALASADAVLDTRRFTGGHTAYLAFSAGVPVVTWNGDLMRGRMTAGLYRQMGIEGPVADDDDEFAELAVSLAQNSDVAVELKNRVAAASHLLFDDKGSVQYFSDFLSTIL
ncbi:MAG: tetratricopeptide repeat protein [Armatimonadetes bacterium]|nr:tetratricopeptide repeat protein [Armatimonadota bacterium]